MAKQIFTKRSVINCSVEELFAWHKRPDAFEQLRPHWHKIDILEKTNGIEDGARVTVRIHAGKLKIKWTLEHTGYEENRQFCDRQISGPFRSWFHKHVFKPAGQGAAILEDLVEYELPFGCVGQVAGPIVKAELKRLFDYRHAILTQLFAAPARASSSGPEPC